MPELGRRLKQLEPLALREWGKLHGAEVGAARNRLSNFMQATITSRMNAWKAGESLATLPAPVPYDGIKADRELVDRYDSQFFNPYPDGKAELMRRRAEIRERRKRANEVATLTEIGGDDETVKSEGTRLDLLRAATALTEDVTTTPAQQL